MNHQVLSGYHLSKTQTLPLGKEILVLFSNPEKIETKIGKK